VLVFRKEIQKISFRRGEYHEIQDDAQFADIAMVESNASNAEPGILEMETERKEQPQSDTVESQRVGSYLYINIKIIIYE